MTSSSSTSTKAIIWGATGAIGTELAQILAQEPKIQILAATRNPNKPSRLSALNLPQVTIVQGDPFDAQSVLETSRGCDVIYCCIGFEKYTARYWAKHWPLVVDHLLQAVVALETKLVFCDNIYAYGAGHAEPITTATPTVPASTKHKPEIRSLLRETFQRHMTQHPGTLAVVGGADFFGPHVTNTSFLGDTLTGKLAQGQAPLAVGAVATVHDFCYARDFAQALATAGAQPTKSMDRFWMCPHTIHGKTLQEIGNDIAQKVQQQKGQPENSSKPVKFSVLNKFLLYLLSPFMEFASEMIEMLPFWTLDYRVGGDAEFCDTFDVAATPYDQALDELVDFYLEQQQQRTKK